MFGNKKKRRVINSLFEMYKIAHDAISSAHMEGVYTVDEYKRIRETYSNTMLIVAKAVSGEEGVLQLSMLCEQFHDENVKKLDKELEGMKERDAGKREEEKVTDVEEKYDGYVTTVTKSPVYSDRWRPMLSEQAWRPAIGEAGWHAREGEMGPRRQERSGAEFVIGGGRGVESGPLRGADERPAVEYIYHIILVPLIDCPVDVLNERDKLINVLRSKGFKTKEVYADTLSVHTEKPITEFEELIGPIYRSTGIQCGYELKYKGKLVPVVRYKEE